MSDTDATREVVTNLFTEHSMWNSVGGSMTRSGSRQDFEDRAKRWLKDNSELSGRVIDDADWDEVYEAMTAG